MALRNFLRVSTKSAAATGIVAVYYHCGLWKDSEETIKNYNIHKKQFIDFIDSVPVVGEVCADVSKVVSRAVSPATEAVSNFRKEWLNFDLSWMRNQDGIIKPTWNKGVGATFDFLAHSPETLGDLAVTGWNKAYELATEPTIVSSTTTTTTGGPSTETPKPASTSIKQ